MWGAVDRQHCAIGKEVCCFLSGSLDSILMFILENNCCIDILFLGIVQHR